MIKGYIGLGTRASFGFGNGIKLHLLQCKVSPSHSLINSFNAKADRVFSIREILPNFTIRLLAI